MKGGLRKFTRWQRRSSELLSGKYISAYEVVGSSVEYWCAGRAGVVMWMLNMPLLRDLYTC